MTNLTGVGSVIEFNETFIAMTITIETILILALIVGLSEQGATSFWRRSAYFLAQVSFSPWYLRRKSTILILKRRRSHPFFLTCANFGHHLRHNPEMDGID